jgi:hypothetical protein
LFLPLRARRNRGNILEDVDLKAPSDFLLQLRRQQRP